MSDTLLLVVSLIPSVALVAVVAYSSIKVLRSAKGKSVGAYFALGLAGSVALIGVAPFVAGVLFFGGIWLVPDGASDGSFVPDGFAPAILAVATILILSAALPFAATIYGLKHQQHDGEHGRVVRTASTKGAMTYLRSSGANNNTLTTIAVMALALLPFELMAWMFLNPVFDSHGEAQSNQISFVIAVLAPNFLFLGLAVVALSRRHRKATA